MTRYAVILADPPWEYRAWKGDRGMHTAESFYPTMREHSRKPDEQYARIERLYGGSYLELFARRLWGDEAPLRAGALQVLDDGHRVAQGPMLVQ